MTAIRGLVDADASFVAAAEAAQPISRQANYPASREGVRGPVDTDDSLVAALPISPRSNYPASREGVRGPVDSDSSFASTSRLPSYPASREGVRGPVSVD